MKRAILEFPADFVHFAFIECNDYHAKVVHGLPKDATFCACHYDHRRRRFQLIYESEQFDDIEEGVPLPILDDVECNFVDCGSLISEMASLVAKANTCVNSKGE